MILLKKRLLAALVCTITPLIACDPVRGMEFVVQPHEMLARAITKKLGVEPVAYAIDQLQVDINVALDEQGHTALHLALSPEYYDKNICIFLLKRGATCDAQIARMVGAGKFDPAVRQLVLQKLFASLTAFPAAPHATLSGTTAPAA